MKKYILFWLLIFLLFSCNLSKEATGEIKYPEVNIKTNITPINQFNDNVTSKYTYGDLRWLCKKWSYWCFYYIALLEANNVFFSNDDFCPINYQKIDNNTLWYSHIVKELPTLNLCKKQDYLEPISLTKINSIKSDMIKWKIKDCFDIKLEEVLNNDYLFDSKLEWLKIDDFKDEFRIFKLEWNLSCTDMLWLENKIVFYSDELKQYYLAEDNNFENFLKWDKWFIIQKDFVWLWEQDHNIYFNWDYSEISDNFWERKNNYKDIIKIIFENNNPWLKVFSINERDYKINNWEINWNLYDYNLWYDFEGVFKENKFNFTYKYNNPYRWNLFVSINQEIVKEAENICSTDSKPQVSNVKIFIFEISDSFELLNKKEIYSENNVKQIIKCNKYN